MRESLAITADQHLDTWDELRRDFVLWRAYGSAGRHLVRLLPPVLLVFPPIGLLAVVAFFFVLDPSSTAIVNESYGLIGPPGTPLLVWSAAVLVVSVAGQAVALPATVLLAAARLAGRHVSASDAMRAAARRLPATALLVLRGGLVVAAVLVGVYVLVVGLDEQVAGYLVMAVLLLLAMPCLLGVAAVVLEDPAGARLRTDRPADPVGSLGRTNWPMGPVDPFVGTDRPVGPLSRAYRLARGATWGSAFTLAFGVVLFPALITQVVNGVTSGTPLLRAGAVTVVALVLVPFQAMVIARLFLHRLAAKDSIAGFDAVIDGLPASAPRPIRPVPLLAGLLLPGLLYGGAVLVNPRGLLEVSETIMNVSRAGDPGVETVTEGTRSKPSIDWPDLRALYAGQDGRMVMLMDDSAQAKLLTCADSACTRGRLTWAEPEAAAGEYPATGARLADGRIAVTSWAIDEMYVSVWDENWTARLGLRLCDAKACVTAAGSEPLAEATEATKSRVLALAARPGGGLALAQLRAIPLWKEDDGFTEVLSITTCDDPSCARRRTEEVARLPGNEETEIMRELVAGVGPDDRPVVLGVDRHTGSMVVISCDDPACAKTRTERPVKDESPYFDRDRRARAAMAIRADGRPLIVYRDVTDSAIKLLDCLDHACARAGTATLTEPGERHSMPALALSRDGRAYVAYQDVGRAQVVIATCAGTRCARTPVARIRQGGDHGLAMALDGRGRPVLSWVDFAGEDDLPAGDEWSLVVTAPLTLR
ncbi:hypothetical protein GCM10009733_038220 [Nonomuraea maheshkhaliensis]|uniref:ABC transporter permease n=1 Tax=Nonomuraea maheshkhaliensis TaxID=419590 RepID=A0ABP4R791_9ACTN